MSELARPRKATQAASAILVINCGSSSVKFALFAAGQSLSRLWSGSVDRIGLANGHFHIADADGATIANRTGFFSNHETALGQVLEAVERDASTPRLMAVGHRVVHGGAECDCPVVVTRALETRLRELIPLAPLHQPHNLAGIAAVRNVRPDIPQVGGSDGSLGSDEA